jgi:hypothetical protein
VQRGGVPNENDNDRICINLIGRSVIGGWLSVGRQRKSQVLVEEEREGVFYKKRDERMMKDKKYGYFSLFGLRGRREIEYKGIICVFYYFMQTHKTERRSYVKTRSALCIGNGIVLHIFCSRGSCLCSTT